MPADTEANKKISIKKPNNNSLAGHGVHHVVKFHLVVARSWFVTHKLAQSMQSTKKPKNNSLAGHGVHHVVKFHLMVARSWFVSVVIQLMLSRL